MTVKRKPKNLRSIVPRCCATCNSLKDEPAEIYDGFYKNVNVAGKYCEREPDTIYSAHWLDYYRVCDYHKPILDANSLPPLSLPVKTYLARGQLARRNK